MGLDDETRSLLRAGDDLARAGDHAGALEPYARAARLYAASGFALRAIAVYRHIRDIIHRYAPEDRLCDQEAQAALRSLYRSLGLFDDEVTSERETSN